MEEKSGQNPPPDVDIDPNLFPVIASIFPMPSKSEDGSPTAEAKSSSVTSPRTITVTSEPAKERKASPGHSPTHKVMFEKLEECDEEPLPEPRDSIEETLTGQNEGNSPTSGRTKLLSMGIGSTLSNNSMRMSLKSPTASCYSISEENATQFSGSYWANWRELPTETMPFRAPSEIRAILTVPPNDDTDQHPSIIIVCERGEIIAFSPFESRSLIAAPDAKHLPKPIENNFEVYHAAYDHVTDEIYVTLQTPFQPAIFRANRHNLLMPVNSNPIQLGKFIETSTDVNGISLDAKRRLLFACQDDMVSIWWMPSPDSSSLPSRPASLRVPRFATGFTCITDPCYLASFFDEEDDTLKLAISQSLHSKVVLLQAKLSRFSERISSADNNANSNSAKMIDDIFTSSDTIASKRVADNEKQPPLGSVYYPWEVIFDLHGNLFVADGQNNRFQIFTLDGKTMKAVWKSGGTVQAGASCGAWQLAVVCKADKPAILVGKSDRIDWYYLKT